jgi:hypothetical protein
MTRRADRLARIEAALTGIAEGLAARRQADAEALTRLAALDGKVDDLAEAVAAVLAARIADEAARPEPAASVPAQDPPMGMGSRIKPTKTRHAKDSKP